MAQNKFFDDPAIDRMLQTIVSLSRELYVTRDRMAVLERLLESKGVIKGQELEGFVPDSDEIHEIEMERTRYISAIFDPMIRDSSGP